MRRFIISSVMAFVAVASSFAKVVKEVVVPDVHNGSLSEYVSSDEKYTIDSIRVVGYWANSNFEFLKDCIKNGRLTGIDMSEAICREIPDEAFCPMKINSTNNGTLGRNADGISALQNITLPKSLISIGRYAFSHTSLKSITIPKLVKIGAGAFAKCPFLESVRVPLLTPPAMDMSAFDESQKDMILHVPSGSRAVYLSDVKWCGFKEIKEEDSLFVVREYYVDGRPLESMVGDETCKIDSMKISGHITCDDFSALRNNISHGRLSGIDLSSCSIENDWIPDRAFIESVDKNTILYPSALHYIKIPEGVNRIGQFAFCKASLISLTIPATVESVFSSGFEEAYIYGDLVIPEGCKIMYGVAFNFADIKGDVYLPSTLEILLGGDFAFYIPCLDGKKFYYNRKYPPLVPGNTSSTGISPFVDNMDRYDCTLYVPVGAKAAFAADEYWGKFRHIIETPTLDGGVTAGVNGVQTVEMKKKDRIYTLDGRYLGSDIKALKSGVYVINGKKVVK